MQEVKRTYTDPVTGDVLSRLEYLTRQVQVVVRTPWFILGFNLLTVSALLAGHVDAWNFVMSWLAIIIEWLVGTYMFGQTSRDAIVTRRNARLEEQNQQLLERIEQMEERILATLGPTSCTPCPSVVNCERCSERLPETQETS